MLVVNIAVIEKSEIVLQWVKLGFKALSEKVRTSFHHYNTYEEIEASGLEFDLVVLGSGMVSGSTEDQVNKAIQFAIQYPNQCFYLCNELDSTRMKLIGERGFKAFQGIWQRTQTSPSSIEKDVLDSVKIPYLVFNRVQKDIQTILIVDDAEISRRVAMKLVSSLGYQVYESQNGLEAVELCKNLQPDAVFMDFEMPIMGGLEASTQIKSFNAQVIILGLSAHNKYEVAGDAQKAQMDGLIEKPIKKDFVDSILRVFSNK